MLLSQFLSSMIKDRFYFLTIYAAFLNVEKGLSACVENLTGPTIEGLFLLKIFQILDHGYFSMLSLKDSVNCLLKKSVPAISITSLLPNRFLPKGYSDVAVTLEKNICKPLQAHDREHCLSRVCGQR